ncbi:RNA polymerase sigma factor [Verrucomicrobiota bacterium]
MSRKKDILKILIQRHQNEIYRYLRYLGARDADAEDITQETFLAAYKSKTLPNTADPKRIAAWLRGVARNQFYLMCRKHKRYKAAIEGAVVNKQALIDAENVWQSEFLRDGDGFDYMDALHNCLERLREKERNIIDMRYKSKTSRQEMAQHLSMTENGVKSLLRRIRNALRDCVISRLGLGQA